MKRLYIVTVTPKFQYFAGSFRSGSYEVEVRATSKRNANREARAKLEREGHIFTGTDACTFSAREFEVRRPEAF